MRDNNRISVINLFNGISSIYFLGLIFFFSLIKGIGLSESYDCGSGELSATFDAEVIFICIYLIVGILCFINLKNRIKALSIISIVGCFTAFIIPLIIYISENFGKYTGADCTFSDNFSILSFLFIGYIITSLVFGILHIVKYIRSK